MTNQDRRQYLTAVGVGLAGSFSGCLSDVRNTVFGEELILGTEGEMSVEWYHEIEDEAVGQLTSFGNIVVVQGKSGEITAVNIDSRETEWIYDGPGTSNTSPIASTDEHVFVWNGDHIEAVRGIDGSLHWQSERVSTPTESVRYGTVVVDKNLLYIGGKHPAAFDAKTGDLKWENEQFDAGLQPVFDEEVMYVPTSHGVATLNRSDGSVARKGPDGGQNRYSPEDLSRTVARPKISEDEVVFLAGDVYVYERETAELRWQTEIDGPNTGIAVANDIVFASGLLELLGLNLEDGEYQTSYQTNRFDINTAPIANESSIYVGCRHDTKGQGSIYSFDVNSRDTNWVVTVDEQITTDPIIIDGTIYVAGTDHLFALTENK